MSKIIIGIHGLRNKPPKKLLEKWWKQAIREGLKAIGHPRRFFRFKLVYWADILYPKPLDPAEKNRSHPLYIDEPYVPARLTIRKRPSQLRKMVLDYFEKQLDRILLNEDLSINYSAITDLIIRRYFRDLDIYYSKTCKDRRNCDRPAKNVIREELAQMLRKHKNKEILLIAHSMGSIIAYDVLAYSVPHINIHTLVTMGSPLGLPVVMAKILSEQGEKIEKKIVACTPENVSTNWFNFSDLKDKVAVNYNLSDDYKENSHHVIAVDTIVYNDYKRGENRNPHKDFGYLRTPELAAVIHNFLSGGRPRIIIWITDRIYQFLEKVFKNS
jgi:hypothetical protein